MEMRVFRLLLALWILLFPRCGDKPVAPPDVDPGQDPSGEVTAPHIFEAGKDGYHTFRIPALVKTRSGTLLAFCEGRRHSASDTGDIDLVLRRSRDGGKTWSSLITVWNDGINTCGNPSPVVDPATGRIHLLMTWNYTTDGKSAGDFNTPGKTVDTRRVWYTFSDDDGQTWKDPVEITSSAKKENWGWYATGPCHAIILQNGANKGRIVIPCDHNLIGGGGYSHVIYSDDQGKTWQIGGEVQNGNESTVAEMADGRIIMSCRASGGYRRIAYSADGGVSFQKASANTQLPDPTCQGSILAVMRDGQDALVHSNCSNSSTRTHMSIKGSTDGGGTWCSGQTVWEKNSAYSDMVLLNDSTLGLLYENGDKGSYERISFEKVPLNFAFIR